MKIIKADKWEQIEKQASAAKRLLEGKDFAFFRDYLLAAKHDIEQLILTNSIREVHDEQTITEQLKRVFITPKKIQVDEIVGQYKFINKQLNYLKETMDRKEKAEKLAEQKRLTIERSYESD